MPKFPQPCTVCGALTRVGSLCETHLQEAKRKKELGRARAMSGYRSQRKGQLYNYAYRKEAQRIKAEATHCHICKQPFTETDKIEADHIFPGDAASPLLPAHRLCNQQRGNKQIDGIY